MTRTITITTERIRRVIVRYLRSPDDAHPPLTVMPSTPETPTEEKRNAMNQKVIAAFAFIVMTAVPARPQGPPFVAGLQLPSKVAFTRHHNLVVAESGTPANNSGRISLIDRATATRRTLIDGLPSGISHAEEPGAPSGPSGVAVQDRTLYVTIGAGDGVLPGPAPGSEQANPSVASPILSSLLSLTSSAALDVATGGFSLSPSDHATLKNGTSVTLHNSAGEELIVRLVADFPDYTAEPRPDFPANVRAGNPFGVTVQRQTLYVVDASQNVVRRVDANTGQTTTLATIAPIQNPLPIGAPFIDPVPDSIHLRGDDLVVTTLTGFPFPPGGASVLRVATNGGATTTLFSGLTSAIDAAPLGDGPDDPLVVLEFSTSMLEGAPGRLRLVTPAGASTTIAEGLPTPTSMAVDPVTGEIFVTHIFPGFITRIAAAAVLPHAPPTAIIPVVTAAAGAFNAHFTTSMQISNPYPFAISGRFVVHPAGLPASASDPSTPYSLAPFQTKTIDSLIANGSGSADVLASVGAAPVIVTTMTETTSMNRLQIPTVAPAGALATGMRGTLLTPSDPSHQRFNIGIRTLGTGANLAIQLHDSSGAVVSSATGMFGPDYFQQFPFADLLGISLGANQAITFEVLSGSAIVYGSAVDNASGIMSLQLAQPTAD
jgi:hypothetical protein